MNKMALAVLFLGLTACQTMQTIETSSGLDRIQRSAVMIWHCKQPVAVMFIYKGRAKYIVVNHMTKAELRQLVLRVKASGKKNLKHILPCNQWI